MYARMRKRDGDTVFDLYREDGTRVTRAPHYWPLVWPLGSAVSARHEHPAGITLYPDEYKKITRFAPIETL